MERFAERQTNAENFQKIKEYLEALKKNHLATIPSWSPDDQNTIITLTKTVAGAIPSSVKSLTLPNQALLLIGDDTDSDRVANWDLMDLKKYAENLARTIRL